MSTTNNSGIPIERWLIGGIVGVFLVRLVLLPMYPLLDRSEARYATVAMHMAQNGDWITPTVDGSTPFWAKPPLAFWLTALSYRVFGLNEFAARLPSYLFYLATTWMVFLIGRDVRDRVFGLLTACVFASMGLAFFLAGAVMTDPALAFSITMAMVSFWFAISRQSRLGGYLVFVAFGVALLSKGPIGVLLPGAAMFVWAVWDGQFREVLRRLPIVTGSLLMLAISVPWYALAEHKTPGFLNYFIIGEHFQRYLNSGWKGDLYGAGRPTPLGMIWIFTLAASLPWSAVVIWYTLRRKLSIQFVREHLQQSWFRFAIAWSLVPLLFFTLARNTLISYALPSLPPLALLVAHLLRQQRWVEKPILLLCGFNNVAVAMIGLAGANIIFSNLNILPSQASFIAYSKTNEETNNQPLTYIFKAPFSAEFYTEGRAQSARPREAAELLQSGKAHVFAVSAAELKEVPDSLVSKLTELGRRDGTILFLAKTPTTTTR